MKGKMLKIAAAAAAMTLLFSTAAFAGEWYHDGAGWRYRASTGADVAAQSGTQDYAVEGSGYNVYCFGEDGYMRTGWVFRDGGWYYYYGDGSQARSAWIDGKYYLDGLGRMETDAVTPDGYYVGGDGAWVPGAQLGGAIPAGTYRLTGKQSHYGSIDYGDERYSADGDIYPRSERCSEGLDSEYEAGMTLTVHEGGGALVWRISDWSIDVEDVTGVFTKDGSGIYTGEPDNSGPDMYVRRIVMLPDGRIQAEVTGEGDGCWIDRYFFSW